MEATQAAKEAAPQAGTGDAREARWREEAGFFDAHAPGEARGIDPRVAARYARPSRFWFNKEYRFRLLGPLAGHRVLDVGCGAGDNSILLALAGAEVTGVDVSPRSIEVAERRARASGLPVAPRFLCAPVETADLPAGTFDVVWGDGLLHHVLPELEDVLARLRSLARPGARFVFSEPVNRAPALRRLREALPIRTDATPGERPLVEAELDIIRRYVPDLRVRPFGLLGRVNRFVLPRGYEGAPLGRRVLANALCAADWALLSGGPLARAGGMAVLHGRFG
jgi:2-polyprenyl-3-methyl-5-hydroxy-6-metoxy-1,4-benzoquinol methylase